MNIHMCVCVCLCFRHLVSPRSSPVVSTPASSILDEFAQSSPAVSTPGALVTLPDAPVVVSGLGAGEALPVSLTTIVPTASSDGEPDGIALEDMAQLLVNGAAAGTQAEVRCDHRHRHRHRRRQNDQSTKTMTTAPVAAFNRVLFPPRRSSTATASKLSFRAPMRPARRPLSSSSSAASSCSSSSARRPAARRRCSSAASTLTSAPR